MAKHLDVVLGVLHHHHENEDEWLWPPMAERAVAEEPAIVALMQEQHGALARHYDEAQAILPRWRTSADPVERAALAAALVELCDAVVQHLDVEARMALPMAERLLTEEKWEAIARHGERGAQGREKLLVLASWPTKATLRSSRSCWRRRRSRFASCCSASLDAPTAATPRPSTARRRPGRCRSDRSMSSDVDRHVPARPGFEGRWA